MLKFSQLQGAIFDVDDTLLNNHPQSLPNGMHEESRLRAAHEVGRKYGIQGLINFTPEQASQAFRQTKVHTLQATVWQMLVMAGEVSDTEIDHNNPLLVAMTQRKDELHEQILRDHGVEVEGASEFVRAVAGRGLKGGIAIASTSYRRDVDIFLELTGLGVLFPEERIITREKLTHGKPHPEAFDLAFTALGLPETARKYVVAIEDDPRGVMSAKAAGLWTVAITTRYDKPAWAGLKVPPDLVVESFPELESRLGGFEEKR